MFKVWYSVVNIPLYQFSISCHVSFTQRAWQHIGVIFRELTLQMFIIMQPNLVPTVCVPFFEILYLGNSWCNLADSEIWNVGYWQWMASAQQKSSSFVLAAQSYVYVKITLLFFLLIYLRCGVPVSWATRHTTVCLNLKDSVATWMNDF